jgi:molecular chaperone GrpE
MESVSTDNLNPEVSVSDSGVPAVDPVEELKAALAERDQLVAEKADLRDQLLRRQADFENYRRRVERERSEFLQYAGSEMAAELLPVLDDFERAIHVETADKEYARGISLIYQRLCDSLKKMGLEPVETDGRAFDPHLHQAVDRAEIDEGDDQAILNVYRKGYNFKGKLLRPAMVKVAVKRS